MSPLIDVTNSGGQNCIVADKASKKSAKKGSYKIQKKKPNLSDGPSHTVEETTEASSLGKLNSGSGSNEPTKMCNTRIKNGVGSEPSHRRSQTGITQGDFAVDSMRVPPLPQTSADDVLSQAVQALSLSPLSVNARPSTRFNRHRKLSYKQFARSSSGHPENTNGVDVIRTPQQCGACGLEFTSLPVLTQHLAKHVYDGLYAAQWLTQAMALVPPRQPLNETLLTPVHSVPSDEGDDVGSQSTQPSPPSGSNH